MNQADKKETVCINFVYISVTTKDKAVDQEVAQ